MGNHTYRPQVYTVQVTIDVFLLGRHEEIDDHSSMRCRWGPS